MLKNDVDIVQMKMRFTHFVNILGLERHSGQKFESLRIFGAKILGNFEPVDQNVFPSCAGCLETVKYLKANRVKKNKIKRKLCPFLLLLYVGALKPAKNGCRSLSFFLIFHLVQLQDNIKDFVMIRGCSRLSIVLL